MADDTTLIAGLAAWTSAADLRFGDAELHQARLCLVDTLACMLAGRDDPMVAAAARAMVAGGASGPAATVAGVALSGPAAALVNGAAAHVLDFDDYEIPGSTHNSAALVPALFALSDLRTVTLGELLTAYLCGYEAIVRTGRALGGYAHYMAGWHATSTIGPLGAAAAAARLTGLDATRTAMALALATSSAAGLKLQFGSHAKPLHAGLAARAGLEAALLAEAGITANPQVTEGPWGFLARYGGGPAILPADDRCAMASDPPLRKPWPSCAYTHRAIEAALALHATPGFDVAAVADGTIRIPEPFFRVAGFRDPGNAGQARFSVLYCVAAALVDGAVTPASFAPGAWDRPAVRALMARLAIDAYDAGPGLADMSPDHPDEVRLGFSDGTTRHQSVAHVRGGAAKPMTDADIRAKFTACGGSAALADRLLDGNAAAPFRLGDGLAKG